MTAVLVAIVLVGWVFGLWAYTRFRNVSQSLHGLLRQLGRVCPYGRCFRLKNHEGPCKHLPWWVGGAR